MKLAAKSLLILMILALVLPAVALAVGASSIRFEALGLTLNMPDDLIVLTRDMAPDDPDYKRSGFTAGEWADEYHDKGYYMRAMDDGETFDITLTMQTGEEEEAIDYSSMTASQLQQKAGSQREGLISGGAIDCSVSPYKTPQATYLKVQYRQPSENDPFWLVEYQTVRGGQAIYLSLYTYKGPATQQQKNMMRDIINTATYASSAEPSPTTTPACIPAQSEAITMGGVRALPELGLTVAMPDDLVVLGQSFQAKDPNLLLLDIDPELLQEMYRNEHYHLFAAPPDGNYEIAITSDLDDVEPYRYLSSHAWGTPDTEEMLRHLCEEKGADNLTLSYHATARQIYYKARYEVSGDDPISIMQYVTVYDGRVIWLSLRKYDGPISYELEARLDDIVDSIVYGPVSFAPPTSALTDQGQTPRPDGAIYSDPKRGVEFIVPQGWKKTFIPPITFIDTTYINNDGNVILYGGMDLWSTLYEEDTDSLLQSALSGDMSVLNELSDSMQENGHTVSCAEYATINGNTYIHMVISPKRTLFSLFDGPMTVHMAMHDGQMALFFFAGDEDSPAYDDYMALLSSARYGVVTAASTDGGAAWANMSEPLRRLAEFIGQALLLGLVLIVSMAIYAAPVLVYRYCIRMQPLPRAKAARFTLIYSVLALAATIVIGILLKQWAPTAAVALWSVFNHLILQSRRSKALRSLPQPPQAVTQPVQLPHQPLQLPEPAAARYCSRCGHALSPGSRYCCACGVKTIKDTELEPSDEKENRK